MHKHSVKALLIIFWMALLLGAAANAAKPGKIDICHAPPDNPENTQRIWVGIRGNALAAHMGHGDWLVTDEMCDSITDNNCDRMPEPELDDADCVTINGGEAGWTCEAGECVPPLTNAVIGSITTDILRFQNAAGESALGDVIADAQLEATEDAGFGDAVVAFMNPGGIRDDLIFAEVSGGELAGEVTFGEAFSVQPFGNSLVTMILTGAQIDTLLEQQFDNPSVGGRRILQVSDGFSYSWSASAATGSMVDPSSIMINGVEVDPGTDYRITVNSFLADGGDNFSVLPDGTNRLGGEVDLDALVTYFGINSPVAPGPQDRITRLPF